MKVQHVAARQDMQEAASVQEAVGSRVETLRGAAVAAAVDVEAGADAGRRRSAYEGPRASAARVRGVVGRRGSKGESRGGQAQVAGLAAH